MIFNMKNIRKGIFETNSSSCHSLTLDETTPLDQLTQVLPEKDGEINIYPGEFGWEVCHYRTPCDKASYCLTYLKTIDLENQILNEKILTEAIKWRHPNCKINFIEDTSAGAYHNWGYIDHQSYDVCAPAFNSVSDMKRFLFSPKSVFETDNDNR